MYKYYIFRNKKEIKWMPLMWPDTESFVTLGNRQTFLQSLTARWGPVLEGGREERMMQLL